VVQSADVLRDIGCARARMAWDLGDREGAGGGRLGVVIPTHPRDVLHLVLVEYLDRDLGLITFAGRSVARVTRRSLDYAAYIHADLVPERLNDWRRRLWFEQFHQRDEVLRAEEALTELQMELKRDLRSLESSSAFASRPEFEEMLHELEGDPNWRQRLDAEPWNMLDAIDDLEEKLLRGPGCATLWSREDLR